jgi:hypothetical protein
METRIKGDDLKMELKELVFENKAWEKAEYPRFLSHVLKVKEDEEVQFEVSYHYVEKKYYVATSTTLIRGGRKDSSLTEYELFYTLDDCFRYIEKKYGVKPIIK